jgi:hypothetical protein
MERRRLLRVSFLIGVVALSACEPPPVAPAKTAMTSPAGSEVGSIQVGLTLSGSQVVREFHYSVTGNNIQPIEGRIEVADSSATLSSVIGGVPVGKGYLLQIAALSDDGSATCSGGATFDVTADEASSISISLVCETADTIHTVIKDGAAHDCPLIASTSAAPKQVEIGQTIQLSATAFTFEPDPVTFTWTTSSGTLSNASTAVSTYTCVDVGAHDLTVEVSDGTCSDAALVSVICLPISTDGAFNDAAADAASDGGADAGTL